MPAPCSPLAPFAMMNAALPLRLLAHAGIAAFLLGGGCLAAQTTGGQSRAPGTATADIVRPSQIEPVQDLRFGTIVRPAAGGTVAVAPNGAVTSTLDLSQFPGNRGAARFRVKGDPNRLFVTFLPTSATLASGTNTMLADQFRANTSFGFAGFDAAGNYQLDVGARLIVGGNQPVGDYRGTFELTVLYL